MDHVATKPGATTATASDTPKTAAAGEVNRQPQETDGFQLVIDALKLNGIDTIFTLPGIPITDLTRRSQAEGIRVLAFRHEQNAGYAASIAGFLPRSRASVSRCRHRAS
jgi:oxalyl-CoA decarboxylase